MIKNKPIKHDISKLIPGMEIYMRSREDILYAYLFGGFARGTAGRLSDVDIAVYISGGNLSEKKLEILGDLNKILKTDEIDLVVLNTAPLTLKMKILQSRRVMADNAPFIRHAHESMTMRSYFDFSKLESKILESRFLNG